MPATSDDPPVHAIGLRKAIADFDAAGDRLADRLRGNPTLDRVMYIASELGDWALIWHLLGLTQGVRRGDDGLASAARISALLGIESLVVNGGIKSLFRRRRPEWGVETDRPHKLRVPRTSSFPSGHASSAMFAAGVLSQRDPNLAPVYYAIAAVVASSRVYVKIHHASDVIGGAVVGVALGAIARQVWPAPGIGGG